MLHLSSLFICWRVSREVCGFLWHISNNIYIGSYLMKGINIIRAVFWWWIEAKNLTSPLRGLGQEAVSAFWSISWTEKLEMAQDLCAAQLEFLSSIFLSLGLHSSCPYFSLPDHSPHIPISCFWSIHLCLKRMWGSQSSDSHYSCRALKPHRPSLKSQLLCFCTVTLNSLVT